jgi:putative hydrolase
MALTNHSSIRDTLPHLHFRCFKYLPREIEGIYLLSGTEVDITDFEGNVFLDRKTLSGLDFRIASKHGPEDTAFESRWGTPEENTAMYLGVMKNPEIDCLGHCGNAKVPFDHEAVIPEAAANGTVIELNTSYLKRSRESVENYRDIIRLCRIYGVRVAVTTDSHSIYTMGDFGPGIRMLEEYDYPEELVINSSMERLRAFFIERKGRDIFEDKMCL